MPILISIGYYKASHSSCTSQPHTTCKVHPANSTSGRNPSAGPGTCNGSVSPVSMTAQGENLIENYQNRSNRRTPILEFLKFPIWDWAVNDLPSRQTTHNSSPATTTCYCRSQNVSHPPHPFFILTQCSTLGNLPRKRGLRVLVLTLVVNY